MGKKALIMIILSFVVLTLLSGVIFFRITQVDGHTLNATAMEQSPAPSGTSVNKNIEASNNTYISPTPGKHR